jgi:hypothetical protein
MKTNLGLKTADNTTKTPKRGESAENYLPKVKPKTLDRVKWEKTERKNK